MLVDDTPKWRRGHYVQVYYGEYEGHEFMVTDIRYNDKTNVFEYLYNWPLGARWYPQNHLIYVGE